MSLTFSTAYARPTSNWSLDDDPPYSVNIWARTTDGASDQAVWSLNQVTASSPYVTFGFGMSGTDTFQTIIHDGSTTNTSTGGTPSTNTWYMLTFVATSLSDFKLYVNGSSTVSDTNTYASFSSVNTFAVGSRYAWTNNMSLAGDTAELSMFDYALSTADISYLYGNGFNQCGSGMVLGGPRCTGYWPMRGANYLNNIVLPFGGVSTTPRLSHLGTISSNSEHPAAVGPEIPTITPRGFSIPPIPTYLYSRRR